MSNLAVDTKGRALADAEAEAEAVTTTVRELTQDGDDTESYTLFVKNLAWATGASSYCLYLSALQLQLRPMICWLVGWNPESGFELGDVDGVRCMRGL